MKKTKEYKDKLRSSGIRATKQRLMISKILFNRKDTFHFTIEDLNKLIEKSIDQKVSLATIYNTVHAFKKMGYLKEISIEGNKTYYDTNTSNHHHFFDEDSEKLTDISNQKVFVKGMPKPPSNKFIKSVEVLFRVASNNHNQK